MRASFLSGGFLGGILNACLISSSALLSISCTHAPTDHEIPTDESESDRASLPVSVLPEQNISYLRNSPTAGGSGRRIAGASYLGAYQVGAEKCGDFPSVQIGSRPGYCVGIVATHEDGLIFPRTIVQIPQSRFFVVVDMGAWTPGSGGVFLLDPSAESGHRIQKLLGKLKSPHGLAIGPDGLTYVGEVDRIFRFNPLAPNPEATVQTIIQNLPYGNLTFADGSKLAEDDHPLKQFIFDRDGNIYLNVGAPSDNCTPNGTAAKGACAQSLGPSAMAAIWKFKAPANKIFPTLNPNDSNPRFEVYAGGLRNSMAMAIHSTFPYGAFLQGENGRDLPDPNQPNEKLNVIEKGKYYGWPYCLNQNDVSPEYTNFLQTNANYKNFCNNPNAYQPPLTLLPPHVAPLSAFYYGGAKFPELREHLLMTWHGYLPAGSRVVSYATDGHGQPTATAAAIDYKLSCRVDPLRHVRNIAGTAVSGIQYEPFLEDWYRVDGIRPQGAPVGLTEAEDGAIWIVEDKNQTILRVDVDSSSTARATLPCGGRSDAEIEMFLSYLQKNPENMARLSRVRTQLVEKTCIGCHQGFNLKPEDQGAARDLTMARFMLSQDGWMFPGNLQESMVHRRTHAMGAEKPMPMNAKELLAQDAGYQSVLKDLDQLILNLVPGAHYVIVGQSRSAVAIVKGEKLQPCGMLPIGAPILVTDLHPSLSAKVVEIFKPADKDLNGACSAAGHFYVLRGLVGPATAGK